MPTIKTEAGKTNHTEQIDNAEQSQIVLLSDFVRKFKPEEGKLRKALAGMYLCREGQDKKFVSDFLETFASSSDTLVCHDGPRLLGAVYMIPAYASVQTDYNNIFEPRKRFYYGYGASVAPGYSGNRICKDLHKRGESALGMRLEQMDGKEAELVINLARYEHDNPGYVKQHWNKATLRPFLTPTSGMEMIKDQKEATIRHKDFTEFIRKADITEEVYYPTKGKGGTATTTYFAHVGIMKNPTETGGYILFANWNDFLGEYFLTGGKANGKLVYGTLHAARNGTADVEKEKLIESFRNFAPTLYKVLTDSGSAVKAIQNFGIGNETLNVFAATATEDGVDKAKDELVNTCIRICKEINATTHLAIWRRYLRTVWLHA